MKKIFLVSLTLLSSIVGARAQDLFEVPAVICANQRVDLESKVKNASSYYWHFCSANISDAPTLATTPVAQLGGQASKTKLLKVNKFFYSFNVLATGELIRVKYDKNMQLLSTQNLSNMNGLFPYTATAIDIIQSVTNGRWYGVVVGYDPADEEGYVARIDFGTDIENPVPVGTNFGKSQSMLHPNDVTLVQEGNNVLAYTCNEFTNSLSRIDFGSSFYNNPSITDIGNTFGLNTPRALISFKDEDGKKYGVYINNGPGSIGFLDFGTDWTSNPNGFSVGNFNGMINDPVDITMIRDCGQSYFYTKNYRDQTFISLRYNGNPLGLQATNHGAITSTATSRSLSEVVRTRDIVHLLETDFNGDHYLYSFDTCDASYSFQSATVQDPAYVKYYTPGTYTIYHVINEGMEDERVSCQTIEILPMPTISITADNLICQRDTAALSVVGAGALSYLWMPDYNISSTTMTDVNVWPDSTVLYTCFMGFPNGCIVDTTLKVDVSRVTADAGPDITVYDASTINIGGPMTSANDTGTYYYQWTPGDEIEEPYKPYTTATPQSSGNIALTVTNDYGCSHSDTARVWVVCDDIHVPNVFNPESYDVNLNKFRILNNALATLRYFRVYNRYGQMVFETTDVEEGWDGYFNGELQPSDNYVWVVEGVCFDGYQIRKQGTVLLVY